MMSRTFRSGQLTVIALACLLLIATACGSDATQPTPSVSPRPTSGLRDPVGRIVIPKLGIDAPLVTKTVDRNGVMVSPGGPDEVAWYDFTAKPGDSSNVVVAGYLYHYTGTAVFARLQELRPGDTISLVWEDDRDYRYRVISYEASPNPESQVESVVGSTDQDVITLIGTYGSTDAGPRVILRAELVS